MKIGKCGHAHNHWTSLVLVIRRSNNEQMGQLGFRDSNVYKNRSHFVGKKIAAVKSGLQCAFYLLRSLQVYYSCVPI